MAALLEHTDGNPLFVREMARLLADDGALEAGATHSARLREIPTGLQDTIRRRFERLPPDCAAVLARAAVLGREFDVRALERMLNTGSSVSTSSALDAAAARG